VYSKQYSTADVTAVELSEAGICRVMHMHQICNSG